MGKEIERKFLVDKGKWEILDKPQGEALRQGYLLLNPEKTIRVRLSSQAAFLTIKGITTGATRMEYEYEIPQTEASELLNNFSVSSLSKIRYKIKNGDKTWEVDVFEGENAGLIIAEIELNHEHEKFPIPEWVGQEVTNEAKYYNSNLTTLPYNKWK